MDLQQATLTMALIMKKEIDFYRQFIKDLGDRYDDKAIELRKQYEYVRANTREYGNRLAANPYFFDVMESWCVTVSGREGVSEETMQQAKRDQDAEAMIEKAGNLAGEVKSFLVSKDFPVAGMGAGEDGWDVGLLCTDKASKELCRDIHQRFAYPIKLGMLSVSRRFTGHCLPGLYTWDDAERILKAYGNDLHI
jgi:hypothetical protein